MSKSIDSGVKIFIVLEILFNSPKSIEEISEKLLEYNIKADKKAISKYLRTIKLFGFDIEKINGKFQVLNSPVQNKQKFLGGDIIFCLLDHFFDDKNIEYRILKRKFRNIFDVENNIKIKELIDENFKYSKTVALNIEKINNLIKKNKKEVNAIYKEKKLKLTIKEIKFAKNGVFLYAKDKGLKDNRYLKLNYIEKIKPDKTRKIKFEQKEGINFKIKENLIKNYILKKGEQANYINGETIITNCYEDKEEIFSRVLKYGTKAEILTPEKERKQFVKKIKGLIKYYKSI